MYGLTPENELKITTELIAKDESNKFFKGTTEAPITINIELPTEIKEAEIEKEGLLCRVQSAFREQC